LVEKLAYAVATSKATETVIAAPLTGKAEAVVNNVDVSTAGKATAIIAGKDAKNEVVKDKDGGFKVVKSESVKAVKAASKEAGIVSTVVGALTGIRTGGGYGGTARSADASVASNRAVGTNADGSLTGESIGLIVGCIVGAALIAVVVIAFSVVRKRRTSALDANKNTPLLQDKAGKWSK